MGVDDRMTGLAYTMIVQKKQSPKLRASAAQCRALVPVVLQMAQEVLSDLDRAHRGSCQGRLGGSQPVLHGTLAGHHILGRYS